MVSLRLKGPRRRESERVKTRQDSNPAIEAESQDVNSDVESNKQETKSNPSTKSGSKSKSSMTTDFSTNATPRKDSIKKSVGAMSPGDTIEVHHKPSKAQHIQATEEPSQDVGPLYEHERVMSPVGISNSTAKKKAVGSGKAPGIDLEDDVDMLDAVRPILLLTFLLLLILSRMTRSMSTMFATIKTMAQMKIMAKTPCGTNT